MPELASPPADGSAMPPGARPQVLAPRDTPLLQPFKPLGRNRNFLLLWLGYVVSALGDRIHFLMLLELLCIRLLHQGRYPVQQSAQLNIVMFLPFFLLGPVAGIIADRVSRRAIMVTADLVRVGLVFVARSVILVGALSRHPDVPLLLALLFGSEFVVFIFGALFSPARTALLPNIVHPQQLLRANALTNAAGVIASLAGYAVGAMLIAQGLRYAIFADAGAYVLSASCILLMRMPKGADTGAGQPAVAGAKRSSFWADFRGAVRYLREHRRPVQIIGLELLFWVSSMLILNSLPAIVSGAFHMRHELGYFMAVAGLGMVGAAALLSIFAGGIPKEIGIGWSLAVTGACLALLGVDRQWPVFLAIMVVGSFAGGILLITLETLLQRVAPNYVRGRVMGIRDLVTNAGMVASALPFALNGALGPDIGWVMLATGLLVAGVGAGLVVSYYRHQTLPLPVSIVRRVGAAYLMVVHRFRRTGACTIPGRGPVIVIANHTCSLDPLTLQIGSRRRLIHFMMAKEYFTLPVLNHFFKYLGSIPVNRSGTDIASMRSALRLLQEGRALGIFPEGKISLDGQLQEGHKGAAVLALKSQAVVVPAYISGTRPHKSVLSDFIRPGKYRIRFGRPLHLDEYRGREHDKAVISEVSDRMMAAIAALRQ